MSGSQGDKEAMEKAFNQAAGNLYLADVDAHKLPRVVITCPVQSRGDVPLGCDRGCEG
jgi:hypothetical protein